MNELKEKREEKNQKKSKEKNRSSNRAREAVIIVDGAVQIAAYSEAWRRGFTTGQIAKMMDRVKATAEQCKAWLDYMAEVNWTLKDGVPLTSRNCYRSLRMWKKFDERNAAENAGKGRGRGCAGGADAKENEYERIKRLEALRRVEMAKDAANWELCRERCRLCNILVCTDIRTGKITREPHCAKGCKIPPQLRERPVAPEECPQFKGKEVR